MCRVSAVPPLLLAIVAALAPWTAAHADANTITVPNCATIAGSGASATPTLSQWAMIVLAGLVAMFGFVAMRRRVS